MASKKNLLLFFFYLLSLVLLPSCSTDSTEKKAPQKGSIDKFTDDTANNIVNHIKTPLEEAENAANISNITTARTQRLTEDIQKE